MPEFYHWVSAAVERAEPFAIGIISGIKGSSPQKKGAKAIFYLDGRMQGTLGGGCLEAEIQQRARQALLSNTPQVFELVLDHDFGWDDGLVCGGKVCGLILPQPAHSPDLWQQLGRREETLIWGVRKDFTIDLAAGTSDDWLYQETVAPACALWIAGAGHVAQAVAPLALKLDFEVTVFDDRPALANSQYFPAETKFRVDYWDRLLIQPLPHRPSFGLIVTRGHQHDALVLRHWVHERFVFLGMIGSRRKKRLIFDQFVEDRIATAEELARVACPVGLDILGQSVDEIALSIVAQYVEQRGERVFHRIRRSSSLPASKSTAELSIDPAMRPARSAEANVQGTS